MNVLRCKRCGQDANSLVGGECERCSPIWYRQCAPVEPHGLFARPPRKLLPVGNAFVDPATVWAIAADPIAAEPGSKSLLYLWTGGVLGVNVSPADAAKALGLA